MIDYSKPEPFSISRAITASWDIVFSDIWKFVMLSLVYCLIIGIASTTVLGGLLVVGPLAVGFFIAVYRYVFTNQLEIGDIGKGFKFFITSVLASVVAGFFISIGFVFLFIPGIILTAMYLFVPVFIADKNMDFWEAMEASRKLSSGYLFELSVFVVLLAILNLIGILLCGIGILITIPMSFVAVAVAFNDLAGYTFTEEKQGGI